MNRSRSYLPAIIVALVLGLGLLLGGGAVAAVAIPEHSVDWSKLSRGVQKKIVDKPRLQRLQEISVDPRPRRPAR